MKESKGNDNSQRQNKAHGIFVAIGMTVTIAGVSILFGIIVSHGGLGQLAQSVMSSSNNEEASSPQEAPALPATSVIKDPDSESEADSGAVQELPQPANVPEQPKTQEPVQVKLPDDVITTVAEQILVQSEPAKETNLPENTGSAVSTDTTSAHSPDNSQPAQSDGKRVDNNPPNSDQKTHSAIQDDKEKNERIEKNDKDELKDENKTLKHAEKEWKKQYKHLQEEIKKELKQEKEELLKSDPTEYWLIIRDLF